jgi:hypothetical protein
MTTFAFNTTNNGLMMVYFSRIYCLWLTWFACCGLLDAAPPVEPIQIGGAPQFVFDNQIVDNHWAIKYKREAVQRVFHTAKKHATQPIITGDQPSYLWVIREPGDGRFRMWYQANTRVGSDDAQGRKFRTDIAYAESSDGIHWTKPALNLFPGHTQKPSNAVIGHTDWPKVEACAPCLLEIPEKDRRGFRYVMMYRAKGAGSKEVSGIRLVGSHDGIRWEESSDTRIAHLHSDHPNTISYDPVSRQYVMYCRPKHIYRTFRGAMIDTGASRRIARLTSRSLWSNWLEHADPQTVLIPDEIDSARHFNFFYGMPTTYRSGIYWGFLEPFRMNDFVYTELVTSRDGIHFDRLPKRLPLIEYGPDGSWDDTMIFASPAWVEVGDEWWVYYSGWDGPHGIADRTGAIGLARVRKERFVSLRGPRGGGVVCTRQLVWPGGELVINADASEGVLRVRVSDIRRKPIEGFDYAACSDFRADHVAHRVTWKDRKLAELTGETIRLEFYLQDADLYTFRAVRED